MRYVLDDSEYEKTKLAKLQAQGVDCENIPVHVERWKLVNGELVAVIRPAVHPKDDYQLLAKPDCGECRGYGYVRYVLDQDDIKSAPCHVCFPQTAAKSEWLRRATQ